MLEHRFMFWVDDMSDVLGMHPTSVGGLLLLVSICAWIAAFLSKDTGTSLSLLFVLALVMTLFIFPVHSAQRALAKWGDTLAQGQAHHFSEDLLGATSADRHAELGNVTQSEVVLRWGMLRAAFETEWHACNGTAYNSSRMIDACNLVESEATVPAAVEVGRAATSSAIASEELPSLTPQRGAATPRLSWPQSVQEKMVAESKAWVGASLAAVNSTLMWARTVITADHRVHAEREVCEHELPPDRFVVYCSTDYLEQHGVSSPWHGYGSGAGAANRLDGLVSRWCLDVPMQQLLERTRSPEYGFCLNSSWWPTPSLPLLVGKRTVDASVAALANATGAHAFFRALGPGDLPLSAKSLFCMCEQSPEWEGLLSWYLEVMRWAASPFALVPFTILAVVPFVLCFSMCNPGCSGIKDTSIYYKEDLL